MKTIREDLIDIVELLREGPPVHEFIPEQERFFDAGISVSQEPLRKKGEVVLDGKKYNIVE
tara:strand:- start:200 stop:382 length:183 start_codon:yes stop_codon:yes gene_type:complete